jgi:Ca-activated chloride channel family protein
VITDLHFLRPWWLLVLLVPPLILWLAARSDDIRDRWKGMIAPHLLDKLIVEANRHSRINPSWLLAGLMALGTIAAAGPTWRREAPPFVEDTAPLVIAVDLSSTMDAIDISPSRIERAKLKIHDILAARPGAKTAIVAYAGTAHLVVPLTEDASLIESYSDALATRIMPKPGKSTPDALSLSNSLFKSENTTGTIVFLTDGIEPAGVDALKAANANGIIILGIGTAEGGPVRTADGNFLTNAGGGRLLPKLDMGALKQLQSATGADVATISDDDTDVRWIIQRVSKNFSDAQASEGNRWRDAGWWLVAPIALLLAFSFRRGWVVRVGAVLLAFRLLMPSPAEAAGFVDLWLTPDQQGRLAFEQGDFEGAADHFRNPMWKGAALYRAGRFQDALDAFAAVDTAESWYNQANTLLHLGKFEEAVTAYQKAIEKRKDWPEAQADLIIAERLLKEQQDKEQEQQQQDPNLKPDSVQFDDKGKQGKEGQVSIAEQTSEMWMKNIQASPADLMARKFALEAQGQKP